MRRAKSIIGFIRDDMAGLEADDQRDGEAGIAGVAAGENEAHWPAEAVDGDVPLAGQSAWGAPQSLIAAPPFLAGGGLGVRTENRAVVLRSPRTA